MKVSASKNQKELIRSLLWLALLLGLASLLLFFLRWNSESDSLLDAQSETPASVDLARRPSRAMNHNGATAAVSSDSVQAQAKNMLKVQSDTEPLQEAMRLIDGGKWREAELILQEILQKDPLDEGALVEMAMVQLIDKRDNRAAQPYLQRALEVNPDNEAVLQELLSVFESRQSWPEGLNFLRGLSEVSRKTGVLDYGIGSALVSMGRPAEAVAPLQKAVYDYGYREYTAREGLAEALVDAGRLDEGIREYQAILDGPYRPNQIRVAKIRIGSALIEKKQYSEARRVLEPLQDSDPKDEWVAALLRDIETQQRF